MKKILLLLLLALHASTYSFSQVKKSETIAKKNNKVINVVTGFAEDGSVSYKIFVFAGQNEEYSRITDFISIYSGNGQIVYEFLDKLKSFSEKYEGEDGVSSEIMGTSINIVNKPLVKNSIFVSKERGYVIFKKKEIEYFRDKVIEYCDINKIELIKEGSIPTQIKNKQ